MEGRTGPDFLSDDGRIAVELKVRAQGVRDLHAGLMQLAVYMHELPRVERGLLAIHLPRVTVRRAEQAWGEARAVLHPRVASRVAIAVFARDGTWIDPPDATLVEIANAIASQLGAVPESKKGGVASRGPGLFFEIAKVLLEAWLRRRGALQIQEILRRVGCSYPTAAGALEELENRRELVRLSDRRVELRGLPRQTLGELVVRSEALRRTQWFVDASGRRADPTALLRRLQRANPENMAVGGVVAAHHYDRVLDLQGLPRIDLTLWAPRNAGFNPSLLTRVDPALTMTTARKADSIIAIHHLARAESLFERQPHGLPFADPVETLLDLHELHLGTQADAFLKHVRGEPS